MATEVQLIPATEDERMAAVRRYDVLDTPPDGAFDRITRLAAREFDVPISIVSIVDSDRIWFKSHHGVDVEEIGRDPGLCASAILGDEPWIVENAATDPRALANPLVAGELGLRFYAGAPLTTHDGHNLGTLCVIDSEPREFGGDEAEVLTELAAIVMDELELRLAARSAVGQEAALREQAERMARALQESLLPPALPALPGAELAAIYRPADAGVVGGDFYDAFASDDGWVLVIGDVSGKGARAAAVTGQARHTIRSAAIHASAPAAVLETLNRAMFIDRDEAEVEHFCTALVVFARPTDDGLLMTAAAAGHPPGVLLRSDGSMSALGASAPPAGWYRDAAFEEVSAVCAPGDALVLFTDGLTEARSGGGFVGRERVERTLAGVAGAPADQVAGALLGLIADDDVSARDDVAALVCRVV